MKLSAVGIAGSEKHNCHAYAAIARSAPRVGGLVVRRRSMPAVRCLRYDVSVLGTLRYKAAWPGASALAGNRRQAAHEDHSHSRPPDGHASRAGALDGAGDHAAGRADPG